MQTNGTTGQRIFSSQLIATVEQVFHQNRKWLLMKEKISCRCSFLPIVSEWIMTFFIPVMHIFTGWEAENLNRNNFLLIMLNCVTRTNTTFDSLISLRIERIVDQGWRMNRQILTTVYYQVFPRSMQIDHIWFKVFSREIIDIRCINDQWERQNFRINRLNVIAHISDIQLRSSSFEVYFVSLRIHRSMSVEEEKQHYHHH